MPNWKSTLQKSLKENISLIGPSATYASLATVTTDNKAAVRTVVIRGFVGEHHSECTGFESELFVIHTKKSSDKVKEIEKNPWVEINWYMNGTKEQFRISGTTEIIKKGERKVIKDIKKTKCRDTTSLGSKAFERYPRLGYDIDWEAERLRQFIQLDPNMRSDFANLKEPLEIESIDQRGWFYHSRLQSSLEIAFNEFVLLIIKPYQIRHWSPTTGLSSML